METLHEDFDKLIHISTFLIFFGSQAEDEPGNPEVIILNKRMHNQYKVGQELTEDVRRLKEFGHVSKQDGTFVFHYCKTCDGPLVGHKELEKDCKAEKMNPDDIDIVVDLVRKNSWYEITVAAMDMRPSVVKCAQCDFTGGNRLEVETHIKNEHGTLGTTDHGDKELMDLIKGFIGHQIQQKEKTCTEIRPTTTQITKARQPPAWIG